MSTKEEDLSIRRRETREIDMDVRNMDLWGLSDSPSFEELVKAKEEWKNISRGRQ